jgi:desulfoferrodoxin (superoxide reductase-like protein)
MDGSTLTGFGVAADAPITDWLGRPHVPNLYVRCQGKKTDVVIHTGTSAQPELGAYNSARVRVRFDDGPIERQTWSESTNNEAYFAPSGPAFARRLAKAKRLRWGFNAFRRGEEVGDFDVRGFDALIGTVATQCGWKP